MFAAAHGRNYDSSHVAGHHAPHSTATAAGIETGGATVRSLIACAMLAAFVGLASN
jgi:hypothetical protein